MTKSSLRIGDLVRLKSGGPAMVVFEVPYPDIARCVWFPITDQMEGHEPYDKCDPLWGPPMEFNFMISTLEMAAMPCKTDD